MRGLHISGQEADEILVRKVVIVNLQGVIKALFVGARIQTELVYMIGGVGDEEDGWSGGGEDRVLDDETVELVLCCNGLALHLS